MATGQRYNNNLVDPNWIHTEPSDQFNGGTTRWANNHGKLIPTLPAPCLMVYTSYAVDPDTFIATMIRRFAAPVGVKLNGSCRSAPLLFELADLDLALRLPCFRRQSENHL